MIFGDRHCNSNITVIERICVVKKKGVLNYYILLLLGVLQLVQGGGGCGAVAGCVDPEHWANLVKEASPELSREIISSCTLPPLCETAKSGFVKGTGVAMHSSMHLSSIMMAH